MANKFWVGNGGDWDSTTHWSLTSGGTSGASVPSQNDDVFFDANSFTSGSQTVIDTDVYENAKSINFTGVTNTPNIQFNGWVTLWGGDFTLVSGITINTNFVLRNYGSACKVTSAGHALGSVEGISAILDNLTSQRLVLQSVDFTTNNHNISVVDFRVDEVSVIGSTINITLGSSIITVSGILSIAQPAATTIININCGTAALYLPASQNNIQIGYNNAGQVTLSGSNWSIICPSGTVAAKYTTLVNSHASGGATFTAYLTDHCIDGGGNTGWIFGGSVGLNPPTLTTQNATSITSSGFTGNGTITNIGIAAPTKRGFAYKIGTTGDPLITDNEVHDTGTFGPGAYNKAITGLSAGTGYRVAAYATNSDGIGYGNTVQVTTLTGGVPGVPTVITHNATAVSSTGFTANGTIVDGGASAVTTRGFCYKSGTSGDPITTDSTKKETGSGFSNGAYDLAITGLSAETGYRLRAYAINTQGTAYGATIQVYTQRAGANRCWVGNSGLWNDTAHWSDTSGGIGGKDVPISTDDVSIDSNSFTLASQTIQFSINGWSIDGVIWTGAIRTVGAGKDFTTLYDAMEDAKTAAEDSLYLVYDGTYTDPRATAIPQKCYIRGMGATPAAATWNFPSSGLYFEDDFIIENVTLNCTTGYFVAPVFFSNAITVKISNAVLSGGAHGRCLRGNNDGQGNYPTLTIQHSELISNDATYGSHLDNLDLSKVSLDKVSYTGTWLIKECTGTLALDDKAANPASGYGPDNATFLIIPVSFWEVNSLSINPLLQIGMMGESGNIWIISVPSGVVSAKKTTLTDSHATGGATFYAYIVDGCVDNGGNTGWIFGTAPPPTPPPSGVVHNWIGKTTTFGSIPQDICGDSASHVMLMDYGFNDIDVSLLPTAIYGYIETGDIDLGYRPFEKVVEELFPDFVAQTQTNNVLIQVGTRANLSRPLVWSLPYPFRMGTSDRVDLRSYKNRGNYVRIRFYTNELDSPWSLAAYTTKIKVGRRER